MTAVVVAATVVGTAAIHQVQSEANQQSNVEKLGVEAPAADQIEVTPLIGGGMQTDRIKVVVTFPNGDVTGFEITDLATALSNSEHEWADGESVYKFTDPAGMVCGESSDQAVATASGEPNHVVPLMGVGGSIKGSSEKLFDGYDTWESGESLVLQLRRGSLSKGDEIRVRIYDTESQRQLADKHVRVGAVSEARASGSLAEKWPTACSAPTNQQGTTDIPEVNFVGVPDNDDPQDRPREEPPAVYFIGNPDETFTEYHYRKKQTKVAKDRPGPDWEKQGVDHVERKVVDSDRKVVAHGQEGLRTIWAYEVLTGRDYEFQKTITTTTTTTETKEAAERPAGEGWTIAERNVDTKRKFAGYEYTWARSPYWDNLSPRYTMVDTRQKRVRDGWKYEKSRSRPGSGWQLAERRVDTKRVFDGYEYTWSKSPWLHRFTDMQRVDAKRVQVGTKRVKVRDGWTYERVRKKRVYYTWEYHKRVYYTWERQRHVEYERERHVDYDYECSYEWDWSPWSGWERERDCDWERDVYYTYERDVYYTYERVRHVDWYRTRERHVDYYWDWVRKPDYKWVTKPVYDWRYKYRYKTYRTVPIHKWKKPDYETVTEYQYRYKTYETVPVHEWQRTVATTTKKDVYRWNETKTAATYYTWTKAGEKVTSATEPDSSEVAGEVTEHTHECIEKHNEVAEEAC